MDAQLEPKDLEVSIPDKEENIKTQTILKTYKELRPALWKKVWNQQDVSILWYLNTNFLAD